MAKNPITYVHRELDQSLETLWGGSWWTWVTVTTVGYRDLIPKNDIGRVLEVMLILVGVCMFSLFTAAVSAFFISAEEREREGKRETGYCAAGFDIGAYRADRDSIAAFIS